MGGKQKKRQIREMQRATQLTLAQNAAQNLEANRIAVREAELARDQSAAQNAALIAAEQESAKLLAQVGKEKNLRTEVINDEEVARKKLRSMGRKSAYGFARPSGSGLGGGRTTLG
jgi:hypothetical protein